MLSRFDGLKDYQKFIREGVEAEIEDFYRGPYQKPVLGSKAFIQRIIEKIGEKARVDAEKPQSRQIFSIGIEEIVQATAREYGKQPEALRGRRRRRNGGEARMVAIYLSRQLGGHKQGEIGRAVGLEKASSVSSAFLRTKSRVAQEKKLARRVRRIEAALSKSKKRT